MAGDKPEHACMLEMNAVLEKHNGRLAMGLQITPDLGVQGRYLVATEKIDKTKRKPVPSVMCSYCPFCGKKLDSDDQQQPGVA